MSTQSVPSIDNQKAPARRGGWVALFVFALLLIDQLIKWGVKTNMMLGESIRVTDWFYILFVENSGMAFGWEIGSKLFLTLFRLVGSAGLLWLIVKVLRQRYPLGFVLCLSAIFAGAVGNIIDSVFYGVLFDDSMGKVATFLPEGGGYAGWLHGRVVDMFYFPLIQGTWPAWVPGVGGEEFIFFQPIFNIADACISVGIIAILLFYTHSFGRLVESKKTDESTPAA